MSVVTIDDKKIGVLSDTHGSFPAWQKALALFGPEVRTVLHAGDVLYHGPRNSIPGGYTPADLLEAINGFQRDGGRVLLAEGNCDAAVDRMVLDPEMEKYVSLVWRGKKILMMHGVDLAISGHTHVGSLVREGGVIFLNPGSTTIPKGRDPESAALLDDEGIRIMTLDGGELHFERW